MSFLKFTLCNRSCTLLTVKSFDVILIYLMLHVSYSAVQYIMFKLSFSYIVVAAQWCLLSPVDADTVALKPVIEK